MGAGRALQVHWMHTLQRMMGECTWSFSGGWGVELCDSVLLHSQKKIEAQIPPRLSEGGARARGRGLALYMDLDIRSVCLEGGGGGLQFTGRVLNTGVGVRLIRCSHADAAESVCGAGGGGVRRRVGRRRVEGWGETLRRSWHQRSKVEEEAAAICRTGGGGRGLWSPYPRYHCGC